MRIEEQRNSRPLRIGVQREHVRSRLSGNLLGRLSIPTLVLAELYAWAHGRDDPTPVLDKILHLLDDVELLGFEQDSAERFGIIQTTLLRRGITVNPVDLMIAAVALVQDLTLVTNNTKDFQNIPGLRLEDWLSP